MTTHGAKDPPGVADQVDPADDGLTYAFHLRRDARWSDGVAITAQTFVESFRRLITPELAAEFAYFDLSGSRSRSLPPRQNRLISPPSGFEPWTKKLSRSDSGNRTLTF